MSDDKDVIRIGRGIPAAPAPAPPLRRTALPFVGAGLFLGAATLGVLLVIGGSIFGTEAGPPQVPMPTQSTPSLKVLDEQATCVLVVPVAKDGVDQVLAAVQKPDTVDWPKLQRTHDDLKMIAEISAPTMRDDINQQAAILAALLSMSRTGGKMTFDMTDFKASGLRIGARCARYAS